MRKFFGYLIDKLSYLCGVVTLCLGAHAYFSGRSLEESGFLLHISSLFFVVAILQRLEKLK